LGYGPRAIAHAFRTLSGPGTVAEALEVLKDMSRPESPPIALSFEVAETRVGPSAAHGVTITSVERYESGIRVNYVTVPPLGFGSHGPRGVAKDDLGNDHASLGCHFGLGRGGWHGGLTMPLPPPTATTLRIRITWDASPGSIWQVPAHEVRVSRRVDGEAPVPAFGPVVSSPSPSEPAVRVPPHPALHERIGWVSFHASACWTRSSGSCSW
jgi:hypothetical protein